jgi:hypothetical protein
VRESRSGDLSASKSVQDGGGQLQQRHGTAQRRGTDTVPQTVAGRLFRR